MHTAEKLPAGYHWEKCSRPDCYHIMRSADHHRLSRSGFVPMGHSVVPPFCGDKAALLDKLKTHLEVVAAAS